MPSQKQQLPLVSVVAIFMFFCDMHRVVWASQVAEVAGWCSWLLSGCGLDKLLVVGLVGLGTGASHGFLPQLFFSPEQCLWLISLTPQERVQQRVGVVSRILAECVDVVSLTPQERVQQRVGLPVPEIFERVRRRGEFDTV